MWIEPVRSLDFGFQMLLLVLDCLRYFFGRCKHSHLKLGFRCLDFGIFAILCQRWDLVCHGSSFFWDCHELRRMGSLLHFAMKSPRCRRWTRLSLRLFNKGQTGWRSATQCLELQLLIAFMSCLLQAIALCFGRQLYVVFLVACCWNLLTYFDPPVLFEVAISSGLPANLTPQKPKYWLTCRVSIPPATAIKLVWW